MQLSKIGSKNTYHKCLKELHETKYILYHPSASKFQAVKISMIRLDIKEEEETKYRQLDLFASPKNDINSVPNLTDTSTDINTDTVPNLGHSLKLNYKEKNSVEKTPTKIFEKNKELSEKINSVAGVPNMRHTPSLPEVESFFNASKYPIKEAQKFYYYNHGKGWMLTDKIPITDWQSLAHKWMLNSKNSNVITPSLSGEAGRGPDIQYLYERFLEGQQISKYIFVEHYTFLQLQITEEIKQEALQRRINQLSGSNENSQNQLLEAYKVGNKNDELLIQDEANFISLAKRVAVFNYLKKLQQAGKKNVIDS